MCVSRITGRPERKSPVSEERLMALASLCAAQGKGEGAHRKEEGGGYVEHLEKEGLLHSLCYPRVFSKNASTTQMFGEDPRKISDCGGNIGGDARAHHVKPFTLQNE